MTKYQIYSHYKLPITRDPLKFGKLLDQTNNKFIMQLTTKNIAVINHYEKENFIRIFKNGDLALEFRDKFINENSFIRTINDTRFSFENDKLISTQINNASGLVTIFNSENNYPLYFTYTPSLKINPIHSFLYLFFWHLKFIFWGNSTYTDFLVFGYIFFLQILSLLILSYGIFNILSNYLTTFSLISSNNIGVMTSFLFGIYPKFYSTKPNNIKLRKSKNNWTDLIIKINNKIFNRSLFETEFQRIWNEISLQLNEKNHAYILFKIKYIDGEIVTIGKLQKLTLSDYNWYIDFIVNNMDFKEQFYRDTRIDSILFSYGIKKGIISSKNPPKFKGTIQNLKNLAIPISMNPENYGRIILNKDNIFIIQNNKDQTINFTKFEDYNEVKYFKNGILLIVFKDILLDSNSFIRLLDNKQFHFKNGQQIFNSIDLKTKFISKLKIDKKEINKFITFDIETLIDSNQNLIPYLLCYFDGKKSFSFWIKDFKNVEELILFTLNSLLIRKYNNYKIYMHNMAKFDIIFLLKYLIKVGKINPIIHNNKIISIKIKYGPNNEYSVEFKDSYLTLLASLDKLTKAFGVEIKKSIFPHLFVNWDNLNHEGKVPTINSFFKINLTEYENYVAKFNNNWNLKNEAIKYCNIDCISLYQVIENFNHLIFNLFSINIHKFLTLPSLAFGVFRSKFMKEKNIPQLKGKIEKDIRSGYTGGSVDVFIPRGKNIKCYDVNSLYPFVMYSKEMPIGKSTYFEGNIFNINKDAFGFFYCKIEAPNNIKHPILQTHVKTNEGIRTLSPIGTWEGMLFSEELKNSLKYGYKIEVLWGYTFEKKKFLQVM